MYTEIEHSVQLFLELITELQHNVNEIFKNFIFPFIYFRKASINFFNRINFEFLTNYFSIILEIDHYVWHLIIFISYTMSNHNPFRASLHWDLGDVAVKTIKETFLIAHFLWSGLFIQQLFTKTFKVSAKYVVTRLVCNHLFSFESMFVWN